MSKYKLILFDLDGTLICSNFRLFLQQYREDIFNICKNKFHNTTEAMFDKAYNLGLDAIKTNTINLSNSEIMFNIFARELNIPYSIVQDIFKTWDNEYAKNFGPFNECVIPKMQVIFKQIKSYGYKIALATNAYFSNEMVKRRLEWGGFDIEDFDFIATWDNMHSLKPSSQFFTEILNYFNIKAEETLFIGNDTIQDASSENVGIDCYLIKDFLVERNNKKADTKFLGTLDELSIFVENNLKKYS